MQAHRTLIIRIGSALYETHLFQSADSNADGRRSQVKPFGSVLHAASSILRKREQQRELRRGQSTDSTRVFSLPVAAQPYQNLFHAFAVGYLFHHGSPLL